MMVKVIAAWNLTRASPLGLGGGARDAHQATADPVHPHRKPHIRRPHTPVRGRPNGGRHVRAGGGGQRTAFVISGSGGESISAACAQREPPRR